MVAVVTGSVNGLGRQTVAHFLKEKAQVVGCDIRDDKGEFEQTFGQHARFLRADVSSYYFLRSYHQCSLLIKINLNKFFFIQVRSEDQMQEVFNKARETFGKVDILVNCAGFSAAYMTVTAAGKVFELETYKRLLEVE